MFAEAHETGKFLGLTSIVWSLTYNKDNGSEIKE
jgi:hypothetical protein